MNFESIITSQINNAIADNLNLIADKVALKVSELMKSDLKNSMKKEYLSRAETMKILNISPATLYNYQKKEILKPITLNENTKKLYFNRLEIEKLLNRKIQE